MAWLSNPGERIQTVGFPCKVVRIGRVFVFFPVGVDMVLENQMNRYQRFVGASKFNGLGGLPVGGGKFLRLAVCDDGVDIIEALRACRELGT